MGRRVVRLYLYFLIKSLFLESLTDLIISQGNLSLSGKQSYGKAILTYKAQQLHFHTCHIYLISF